MLILYAKILKLSNQIFAGRGILGRKLWNDLYSMTSRLQSDELKGEASFELFLLGTLGRYAPVLDHDETLDWLTMSARHGYDVAFIVGKRVFAANNQPIPEILRDGPNGVDLCQKLQFLESLPSERFYENAVRLFWTADLRSHASDYLRTPKCVYDQMANLRGMAPQILRECVKSGYWLHEAVIQNDEQIITDLAKAGCDINAQTLHGLTPLHLACRSASTPLIRLLISHGADASINDEHNTSPMHWIILLSDQEIPQIASLLVQNGADLRSSLTRSRAVHFDKLGLEMYGTPLSWACACRNATAVKTLLNLRKQTDLDNSKQDFLKGDSCIYVILDLLCSDILEIILNEDHNLQNFWPTERESIWNHVGVGQGNDFQRWCIHEALVEDATRDFIRTLIHADFPFPMHPQATIALSVEIPPLHRAAMSFNATLINSYIDIGMNVNVRDWVDGHTALHAAIESWGRSIARPAKMLKAITALIDHGASLEDEQDSSSYRMSAASPLHFACSRGAPPCVVKFLMSRAPRMLNKKHYGQAPLHVYQSFDPISNHESSESLRILLSKGAILNIESDHRDGGHMECCHTPVASFLARHSWKFAELLLDRGCSMIFGVSGGHEQTLAHLIIFGGFIDATHPNKNDRESLFESVLDHPKVRQSNIVNHENYQGYSPLEMAIELGLPRYAKILLEHGCNYRLPVSRNISTFVDHKLQYPPPFVVHERIVAERNNETAKKPLMSHSQYRDSLTAIRHMIDPGQQMIKFPTVPEAEEV